MTTHDMTVTVSTTDIKPEYVNEFHALCRKHDVEPELLDNELFAELDVDSSGSCCAPVKGCYCLPNGDPGYPDEAGGCEEIFFSVGSKKTGDLLDITDWVTDDFLEQQKESLYEHLGWEEEEARDQAMCDAADARREDQELGIW